METGLIYKITNPIGEIYIGQSVIYKRRLNNYKSYRCKSQPKIYKSLIEYGFKNHKFEIIDDNININHLDTIETYNIWLYNSYKRGLNCTPTAQVFRGKRHTQESKLKISNGNKGKLKGRIFSEETKKLMSETRKERLKSGKMIHQRLGKKLSEESKLKMSINKIGKKQTPEHIEKVRLSLIGRIYSTETKKKIREAQPNIILNEDLVRLIKTDWKNNKPKLRELSEKYSINQSTITNIVYNRTWKDITI